MKEFGLSLSFSAAISFVFFWVKVLLGTSVHDLDAGVAASSNDPGG